MLSSDIPVSGKYPEWKALLTEILAAIAKRVTSIDDYTSFRGVCSSWRAAASFESFEREFPRVPRLLYFVEEINVVGDALAGKSEETLILGDALFEEREETHIRRKIGTSTNFSNFLKIGMSTNFLDLESNTRKIVNFPPPMNCVYLSSLGWILKIGDGSEHVSLKHFMLGISIKLPELGVFKRRFGGPKCFEVKTLLFITKMVLSGSPIKEADHLVVMVIYGSESQLAFCRPGDESWTLMDWWGRPFNDVIYHNNKLYALDSWLTIVECDIHGSNPTKLVEVFEFPQDDRMNFYGVMKKFLVESFGKFLVVVQYSSQTESHNFRIIQVELNDGCYGKIHNLGKCSLFLGLNSSICVDVPASSCVKLNPNCIYLADVNIYFDVRDVGVYTLCDGCYEDFCGMLLCCCRPSPVWILPTI